MSPKTRSHGPICRRRGAPIAVAGEPRSGLLDGTENGCRRCRRGPGGHGRSGPGGAVSRGARHVRAVADRCRGAIAGCRKGRDAVDGSASPARRCPSVCTTQDAPTSRAAGRPRSHARQRAPSPRDRSTRAAASWEGAGQRRHSGRGGSAVAGRWRGGSAPSPFGGGPRGHAALHGEGRSCSVEVVVPLPSAWMLSAAAR